MIRHYNTDSDMAQLLAMRPDRSQPEVFARRTKYGHSSAINAGLTPVEAIPDVLVSPTDYKDVLAKAHELKILPVYHQYNSWAPAGTFRWNQNGLPYCWTWSGTAGLLDVRAIEQKPTVLLAPVSMGFLVGWKDRGNYL